MSDDVPEQPLPDFAAIDAELHAVDRALGRLDDGTFGRCSVCAEPIDEATLEADPLVDRCARHLTADTPGGSGSVQGPAQTA